MFQKMRNSSLEGALIGVNYVPKLTGDLWSDFSTAYNNKYGAEPDHVAGKSFDTARLLGKAFKSIHLIVSYRKINSTLRETKKFSGAPGRIRTCDLEIRNLALYPPELRAHIRGRSESGKLYKANQVVKVERECLKNHPDKEQNSQVE